MGKSTSFLFCLLGRPLKRRQQGTRQPGNPFNILDDMFYFARFWGFFLVSNWGDDAATTTLRLVVCVFSHLLVTGQKWGNMSLALYPWTTTKEDELNERASEGANGWYGTYSTGTYSTGS